MLSYIYVYLLTVPVFFAIDMFWLGVVAKDMYRAQLGYLLGPVQWPVAIAFYLLFIAGLVLFAVHPAIEARSLSKALMLGAAFGFFCYMTYDLTNWSTIRDWPVLISLVDMAWGTVLGAAVASLSYLLATAFIFKA